MPNAEQIACVVCLTVAKWETVSVRFGGDLMSSQMPRMATVTGRVSVTAAPTVLEYVKGGGAWVHAHAATTRQDHQIRAVICGGRDELSKPLRPQTALMETGKRQIRLATNLRSDHPMRLEDED
jgi:hypothetical protein